MGVEDPLLGIDRPGDVRPEPPSLEEEPGEPAFILPPVPPPRDRLSSGPTLVVREFRVRGATAFSAEELAAVTDPYLGRPLTSEDLHALRDALTLLYVNAGYVNSGAVLPDQDVSGGVVEYRIVEGELTAIELDGNRHLRDLYLRSRLRLGADVPLDVRRLERRLQLLQQDPRIRRVEAELRPGDRPGEAVLRARFEEERPWWVSVDGSNHEAPSIGAYRGRIRAGHDSLLGLGDRLFLSAAFTEGLEDYDARYEIPVTPWDTTVGLFYGYSESEVIERPFDEIDITSRSQTAGLRVAQPVYRSLRSRVEVSGSLEWRESETFLLDRRFAFSPGASLPGSDVEGRSRVTVLRLSGDWLFRDRQQVIAARSTLSFGLDLWGAIQQPDLVEDGQFVTWLAQFQWVRRFDRLLGLETVFRTDLQLAGSALLSLERFAVGGHATVRGYRENELVRDNGVVSSLELRFPLWSDAAGRPRIQIAPFLDVGTSWNTDRDESRPRTLYSAGVGLRFRITRYAEGNIYWARPLRKLPGPADRDLQDEGVHFQVTLTY